LLSTSAYSASEVLHIMRYINLLTYFTYTGWKLAFSVLVLKDKKSRKTGNAVH